MSIVSDVSLYDEAQWWGAQIVSQFGRIDVLVNNAGISQPKTLIEISEAEFDRTIAVNLKSQFNWCKAVAPQMLKQELAASSTSLQSVPTTAPDRWRLAALPIAPQRRGCSA